MIKNFSQPQDLPKCFVANEKGGKIHEAHAFAAILVERLMQRHPLVCDALAMSNFSRLLKSSNPHSHMI